MNRKHILFISLGVYFLLLFLCQGCLTTTEKVNTNEYAGYNNLIRRDAKGQQKINATKAKNAKISKHAVTKRKRLEEANTKAHQKEKRVASENEQFTLTE